MKVSNKKLDFSKLKDIGSMDIKDIGKIFDKNNISYKDIDLNKTSKKLRREKAKVVLAIDIGGNSIKLVEGKYQKENLVINKLMEVPTPEGVFSDGNILDKNTIKNTLEFLISENNIKAKHVTFTTNSSSIITREILIPIVKEDEMETVVKYEIQQYLPINLDEYIIQYTVIDKVETEEGKKLKVNVTSFPKKIAMTYYELINELELNPYSLDVNYNSINKLANYIGYTKEEDNSKGTVAFVDIGATSVNISIFKESKLDFTRMIKIGGDNIDYDLSKNLNMSIKSTESRKIREGSLSEDTDDNFNYNLRKSVDEILEELQRILQFYNNKFNNKIDKLYIYGGTSNINNIDVYMEKRIDIKVNKIEKIEKLELTSKDIQDEDLSKYLNAIGSLIRL